MALRLSALRGISVQSLNDVERTTQPKTNIVVAVVGVVVVAIRGARVVLIVVPRPAPPDGSSQAAPPDESGWTIIPLGVIL